MENKGRAEATGEETNVRAEQTDQGVHASASARSSGQGPMKHETATTGAGNQGSGFMLPTRPGS